MRLDNLEISNFKALKGQRSFEFPEGIIGITGKNGRGKSTLANAIAWSLYGAEALRTGRSDIVTWGEKQASTALTFETHDGVLWGVERSQSSKGTSYANLYNITSGITAATGLEAVNKEVQRILSLDRVGFLTSVYARQEELAGLMSLTPANRVKTVLRLLRMEQLTTAIEQVRGAVRDQKNVLQGLRMNGVDTDQLQSEISAINDDIDACEGQMADEKERLADLEKDRLALVEQQIQLVPLAKKYEIYQEAVSKARIAVAQSESALVYAERQANRPEPPAPGPEPVAVKGDEISDTNGRLFHARAELTAVHKQIETLRKSSICPECKRPFSNLEDRSEHISDLEGRQEELKETVERLSIQYAEAKERYETHASWIEVSRRYEDFQKDKELARTQYQIAYKQLRDAKQYLAAIEPVEDVADALRAVTDTLLETQTAAGQVRETLATLAERTSQLQIARDRLLKTVAEAVARRKAVKAAEKAMLTAETTGVELASLKAGMISMVIPALSERASRLVGEFTDGRYNDVYLTPDYEIQYSNDFGEHKSFQNLSGGEQDVFALALRLAISDLRAGDIGLIMLDEVMESLDNDRQESTWNAIERLTGRYNQILLVTHVQAFKDRAENVIQL